MTTRPEALKALFTKRLTAGFGPLAANANFSRGDLATTIDALAQHLAGDVERLLTAQDQKVTAARAAVARLSAQPPALTVTQTSTRASADDLAYDDFMAGIGQPRRFDPESGDRVQIVRVQHT